MKLISIAIVLFLATACNNSGSTSKVQKASPDPLPLPAVEPLNIVRPYPGELQEKRVTVSFSYAAIACGCAQWVNTKSKSVDLEDEVEHFYLEPLTDSLIMPDSLWDGSHLPFIVKVSGRFSKQTELPVTRHSKSTIEKARIFWYDNIIIVTPRSTN